MAPSACPGAHGAAEEDCGVDEVSGDSDSDSNPPESTQIPTQTPGFTPTLPIKTPPPIEICATLSRNAGVAIELELFMLDKQLSIHCAHIEIFEGI